MIYCDAECQYSKLTWEGESVCTSVPVLSSYTSNRLLCSNYKERSGPVEELHPGRKPNGLFPGQLDYKEN
jgi:hypothetical protein